MFKSTVLHLFLIGLRCSGIRYHIWSNLLFCHYIRSVPGARKSVVAKFFLKLTKIRVGEISTAWILAKYRPPDILQLSFHLELMEKDHSMSIGIAH